MGTAMNRGLGYAIARGLLSEFRVDLKRTACPELARDDTLVDDPWAEALDRTAEAYHR